MTLDDIKKLPAWLVENDVAMFTDGSGINCWGPFVRWTVGNGEIQVDDHFTSQQLRDLADMMDANTPLPDPPEPS